MIQNDINLTAFNETYLSTELIKCIVQFCEKCSLNIIYVTGERNENEDYPRLYENKFHILNKDNNTKIIISIIFDELHEESILRYIDYNLNIKESFDNYTNFEKIINTEYFFQF